MTDKEFGRLKVVCQSKRRDKYGAVYWICDCKCGTKGIEVLGKSLKNGATQSCGCIHKEQLVNRNKDNKKYNTYDLLGDYGVGYTSKGEKFYFDLEDYDKIKDYCWSINPKGYVVSTEEDTNKEIRMHRIVMDVTDSKIFVDHIFHNNYDNRKSKLRLVNNQQNCMNSSLAKNNKSGVIGVHWNNKHGEWRATICYKKKYRIIGAYSDIEDAIRNRLIEEKRIFGEYAPQKHLFEEYGV